MEKDRNTKIIALIALVVAIVGLTVGFATFTNQLIINSSAVVTPDGSAFNVVLSTSSSTNATGTVTGSVIKPETNAPAELTANPATLTAELIDDLQANFTAPGQTVEYKFYARNSGKFKGYLKSVTFNEVETGKIKTCVPAEGETIDADLLADACAGITVTVKYSDSETYTSSVSGITGHELDVENSEEITVIIDYATNAQEADGKFKVTFGAIGLTYSSTK